MQLQKSTTKKLRRLGQGHGSGRGKTGGRGTKGQKARSKVSLSFEGGAISIIKRLPFTRGKGRNNSLQTKAFVINLNDIDALPAKSVVDIELLIKHNIVTGDAREKGVKLLGDGEVKNAYTVKLPVSNSAKERIEKAGGSVESSS